MQLIRFVCVRKWWPNHARILQMGDNAVRCSVVKQRSIVAIRHLTLVLHSIQAQARARKKEGRKEEKAKGPAPSSPHSSCRVREARASWLLLQLLLGDHSSLPAKPPLVCVSASVICRYRGTVLYCTQVLPSRARYPALPCCRYCICICSRQPGPPEPPGAVAPQRHCHCCLLLVACPSRLAGDYWPPLIWPFLQWY
jgi:hypothetical protein